MDNLNRFKNPDGDTSKKELYRILLDLPLGSSGRQEAAQYALDHPDLYNGKIVKLARRIISPKPVQHQKSPPRPPETFDRLQLSRDSGVICALREVKEGDLLTLRFRRECIPDLIYLHGMTSVFLEFTSPMGGTLLMAIVRSEKWEVDDNRTMTVRATKPLRVDWFWSRMQGAIEELTITWS